MERPIIDGFTYSASQVYLPTSYRPSALAQMEVLRRANVYRPRQWCVPETLEEPIVAYSQMEYQVRTQPGALLWGLSFTALPATYTPDGGGEPVTIEDPTPYMHIMITNACTETQLFSDYVKGNQLKPSTDNNSRHPLVLPQPLLVLDPALVDVEIYNSSPADVTCQLVLFFAEPKILPRNVEEDLIRMGVLQRGVSS